VTRIRVEHPDGTTDRLTHKSSKLTREFGKMDLGSLFAPRVEVNNVTLQEDADEVFFEDTAGNDLYGGLLKDVERGGSVVELVVDSFERYAKEAQPTGAGDRKENVADDTIVNEAITAVSQLTAGTVSQIETGLTFVFSHATQAKKIRTVEEATPGEVAYNADKSVDYVSRVGADKSGSVTISPGNQNLDGKIKVKEKGGGKNITHLRMLGAGEGKHQLEVNIVPSADSASYTNKATYSSTWESGDRRVWGDPRVNKEATDTATLERQGLTLIEELNSSYVEVEATIKGVDVDFGDTVHVQKPKDNIDQNLRIVEWNRVEDSEGVRYDCVLSSRQKSRQNPDAKNRQDIQRYNKGFEGTPVTMTAGGGRQPVTSTLDYEFDFYYPAEVEYEHRVKLFVKGLAYRAYSQGAASGGDHTHTVEVTHPAHGHDIPSSEFNHSHDITVGGAQAELHGHLDGTLGTDSHPHSDGTLGAASHPHTDGTLGAGSHPHTDGSLGADSHDHPQNIVETSDPNNPHGAVAASGDQISFVGDTSGWEEVQTISESGYEFGIVHVHATSAENVLECRIRDSSSTNASDTSGSIDDFSPSPDGTAVVGTSSTDGQSSSVTLVAPEDWGFIDVDVRASSGAVNTNVHVAWMLIAPHTHDVTISSPTGNRSAGVTGDTGSNSADVGGDTGSNSADVGGDTSSNTAGVSGETDDESPGVSGVTENKGGIRTSTTELGTTASETSDASGPHTHPPEPGVIESFGGTRHYPGNCDVTVNGQAVGVSLGDGTGPFEQEVDLAGMLNPGQVNTVRISSDSLGHLQSHLDIDVYRQILGNG